MKTLGEKLAGLALAALIAPALVLIMIPLALFNGWVVSVLWGWLIQPTFASAPDINTAEGWGIALVSGYLTKQFGAKMEKDAWVSALLVPPVALLAGWVIKTFFM